jgi:cytidylate kinase
VIVLEAVIISGLPAVGKTTVAKMIADRLHIQIIGGGDILKEIAREHGINAVGEDWWDTEEGIGFLNERKRSAKFDEEVDRRLVAKIDSGDVVITSYTLPWLSKKGIKIWLSGSVSNRAERMAKRDGVSLNECKSIIAVRDEENYKIYKKLYGIEFGKDLVPFDLIVGTDGLDAKGVGEEILRYIRSRVH